MVESSFTGLEETRVVEVRDPFPLLIMYPTDVAVDVAFKAPVQAGRFPLVVISHGTGGSNLVYRTIAGFLAKNGFIVCMPEHPFNNRNNNERADTIENLTDRPRHIRECIDYMFSDSRWSAHLQQENVALIGHSLGAYTALALAGGIPHTQHQIKHDPLTRITDSRQIDVTADNRIKALVLLAPATGCFISEGALSRVTIPILMFSGEKDGITPQFHADIVKKGVANPAQVTHRIVEKAGHFSFLSPFPEHMRTPQFLPAQDPEGFDRTKFHEELGREILGFLRDPLIIFSSRP